MDLLWSHCVAIAKVDARAATLIGSNIHCELELNELFWMNFWLFLDTHLLQLKTVTVEVNNQDDRICALLCHFSALDSHGKPNNFLLLE